jgi:hypothetical protein
MTIKLPGDLELTGTEVCSEKGCARPAVRGFERCNGDKDYNCEPHDELMKLYGQRDWLDGEIMMVEDWAEQVENASESAWTGGGDLKHFLVLRDTVCDGVDVPYKEQHKFTLESIAAAIDLARKLTEERIASQKRSLDPGF